MSLLKRLLILCLFSFLWNLNETFKIQYETTINSNSEDNCIKANQCEILKDVILEEALNEIEICEIRYCSKITYFHSLKYF